MEMEARSLQSKGAGMNKDPDFVAVARRIADAEVDRAVREFESGEDVRYPCYSTIIDGRNPPRGLEGEMRVLYPAGCPVCGTLSAEVVAEPPTGRTRHFINARLPREFVKLDAAAMRDRARRNAEHMAKRELERERPDIRRLKKLVLMALWNGCLRREFARQFSEAAKAHPGKLETFVTHRHLVKCGGQWLPLMM